MKKEKIIQIASKGSALYLLTDAGRVIRRHFTGESEPVENLEDVTPDLEKIEKKAKEFMHRK